MKQEATLKKGDRIYVAGHRGMVGSAIVRRLNALGYTNILTRSREELDLIDQASVNVFMSDEKPDYVVFAAALVGGIQANNTLRADFIYQNLMMEANVIHSAWKNGVKGLLFWDQVASIRAIAPNRLAKSTCSQDHWKRQMNRMRYQRSLALICAKVTTVSMVLSLFR